MKIVATTSNLIGAVFIRWLVREPASHLIFVFNDVHVIHSSLFGVQMDFYKTYRKHIKEVDSVDVHMPLVIEDLLWQRIMLLHDDTGYDYKNLFYAFWRAILWRFLKIPPPRRNKWDSPNLVICTEMYNVLRGLAPELKLPDLGDVSLRTPLEIIGLIKQGVSINAAK